MSALLSLPVDHESLSPVAGASVPAQMIISPWTPHLNASINSSGLVGINALVN